MIHLYTNRKHNQLKFKILCTGNWVETEAIPNPKGRWYGSIPQGVTTVVTKVTCRACLDILIPKREAELNTMKNNLGTNDNDGRSEPQQS